MNPTVEFDDDISWLKMAFPFSPELLRNLKGKPKAIEREAELVKNLAFRMALKKLTERTNDS